SLRDCMAAAYHSPLTCKRRTRRRRRVIHSRSNRGNRPHSGRCDMRMGNIRMRLTLAAGLIGGFTLQLWAQVAAPAATPQARNPFSGDPKAVTQGAVLFRQECVFCHGVGARGGMRGPDLTTGSWNHGGSDADLARTI